ncbi:MAG: hypothetical protein WCV73_02570 [Patescibacteria group bacterium]|jgi:hypothetical protein
MLANLGLILIILGWLYQLSWILKSQKEIQTGFLTLYGLGVLLLIIDGFYSEAKVLAWLNLIILGIIFLIRQRVSKR